MNTLLTFDFVVDKENNTIHVTRAFKAPRSLVWAAWTQPEILDQWWAPKPYVTRTKSMDFRPGGAWLYAMISPEGETHWCRADYITVEAPESYSGLDAFCDENGVVNTAFPRSEWHNRFEDAGDNTIAHITIRYEKLSDLESIIQLGFREGFTMALGNLDEYLAGV